MKKSMEEQIEARCPLAGRAGHPEDTVVQVGEVQIGGGHFAMMGGPCSVESREQILTIARAVKAAGGNLLRGGAFKPRTSPYEFQGLGEEGIRLLVEAGRETGLPVVTEIVSAEHLPLYDRVDVLQVGTRSMQNFELLKALGRCEKPILLKRGLGNTLEELLLSAEYIMREGNRQVMLCERGIRTFTAVTRNTLDLSAVPVLHAMSHLPVIVDPSHATGKAPYVSPMALAAAACGADGLIIEVHNNPACALSDGPQALLPEEFAKVARQVEEIRAVLRE